MLRLTSQMCLIVWVLLCAVRLNTISCCHESDRSLLLMFKEGVVDPSNRLSSWSSLQDCCLWKGVSCGDNNRVNSLDLSSDNHSESLRGLASISFQDDRLPGIFPIKNSIFPIKNSRENGASLYTKGQKLEYVKYLYLVRSIDLSVNELFGEIPAHLFSLDKLKSLNLSSNYLRGEIPEQIGQMKYLESLDFSHNSLDGNIPQSMCSLSFLSALSLSDNNFSGQIPLGTQLQGFGAWSYIGNPELCGPPLQKKCTISEKTDNREQVEGNDDNAFLKSLYLGMGVGFAVGFWVVCGSLFLNRAWRHTYFRFFNGMVDRIYVIVAIKLRIFY